MSNRALFEAHEPGDIEAARGGDCEARLALLHDFVWELRDGEPLSPELREYFGTVLGRLLAAFKLRGKWLLPHERPYFEKLLAAGKEPTEPPAVALGLRRPRGRTKAPRDWVGVVMKERLALRLYDAAIRKGESHTKALTSAVNNLQAILTDTKKDRSMPMHESTLNRLVVASGRRQARRQQSRGPTT